MIKKLYLGIDPDLRLLNAALIDQDKNAIAVFARKNKGLLGDSAVAAAVSHVKDLVNDIVLCVDMLNRRGVIDPVCTLVVVVESQSMTHAQAMRKKGNNVNYQDILTTGQMAGIMMGAFSVLADKTVLVQPVTWKGTIPKPIAHKRYYSGLGLVPDPEKRVSCIYPDNKEELCAHSGGKINMGDFWDINDSLGLALYGAKKNL